MRVLKKEDMDEKSLLYILGTRCIRMENENGYAAPLTEDIADRHLV